MSFLREVALAVPVLALAAFACGGSPPGDGGGNGAEAAASPASDAGDAEAEDAAAPGPDEPAARAYEVTLDTLDPQPTLSVRGPVDVADIQSAVGERTRQVWEHLQKRGAQPTGPPFTRYHAVDGGEADLEVGFPVAGDVEGGGGVEPGRLPGGEVIRTVHRGPYGGLVRAGAALDRWLEEHDREARGPNWEVYRVNAGTVEDPSGFRTDVFKPIR